MNTLSSSTRISIQIIATDDDGSLQRLVDAVLILASQLLLWVELQLRIADVARDLIVETRVLIGLMIVICERVNRVLDWCEDWYLAIGYTVATIRGLFVIRWGYIPG
jgi:hypothetical protein